ncbi:MAG: TRAP transporter large permease subunit, partial [Rhodospirillales bacterium]|nr:TRAP transporter large permease subunit [Rhodospirillales bacterium]
MTATAVFLFLLVVGAPVALVMAFSGLAGAISLGGLDLRGMLADRMFSGVSGFVLIAVPYFIFTAELMNQAGLTQKLVTFNNALLGRVPVLAETDKPEPGVPVPPFPPPFPVHSTMVARSPCSVA